MRKYTLDQITGGQYVFLERPEEEIQLSIPADKISTELKEGDIVTIHEINKDYEIEVLKEETKETVDKVNALLNKLQNR